MNNFQTCREFLISACTNASDVYSLKNIFELNDDELKKLSFDLYDFVVKHFNIEASPEKSFLQIAVFMVATKDYNFNKMFIKYGLSHENELTHKCSLVITLFLFIRSDRMKFYSRDFLSLDKAIDEFLISEIKLESN